MSAAVVVTRSELTPAQLREVLGEDDGDWAAALLSVTDAGIELEVDRQPVSVPFDEIEKARLAPEAPAPMRR